MYPIAGDLRPHGGYDMDATAERLSTSDSTGDGRREGVRLVLNGGRYPLRAKGGTPQKAIIEFVCDHEKDGTEGEWDPEEKYDRVDNDDSRKTKAKRIVTANDEKSDKEDSNEDGDQDNDANVPSAEEHQLKYDNTSLIFESFKLEGSNPAIKTLRLTWYTKYACETAMGNDPGENVGLNKSHWGFFTWFVVM